MSGVGDKTQSLVPPSIATWFGRIGYGTKGVVFIIIAVILFIAVFRNTDASSADKQGVVQFLATRSGGVWLLWILVIGLYCYALWRLYEGISGISEDPSKPRWKRILTKRLLPIYSAVFYAYFATTIILNLTGSNNSSGGGGTSQEWSVKILRSSGGIAFFIIIGIFFFLAGCWQLKSIIKGSFRRQLKTWEIPPWARKTVLILGYSGLTGKALVFWLIAYTYWKTAGDNRLRDNGLGGALGELQDHPAGKVILFIMALLLLAYGIFNIILAKYKDFLKNANTTTTKLPR